MNSQTKKVIIDCERMKYPNTGLYDYCKNLCKAIIEVNEGDSLKLGFYVRKKEVGIFNEQQLYINQHSLHKFILPSISDFNIWHATYQGTMYFPFNRKIKIVLTIHDLNFMYETNRSEKKKKKELNKIQKKINRADSIVAISNYVKNDIIRFLDVQNKQIEVIYNGCNINTSGESSIPLEVPRSAFLFTIGTIIDKKNFHVLPALLVGNEYELLISGTIQSEEYKNKIIQEAIKHNVESRVKFTGPISEKEKYWYYQNCKAFVFPSLMEGFGLPVIEAMAFKKPVFLSSLTSLPEIGGDAAFYFDDFSALSMQLVFNKGLNAIDSGELNIEKIYQRSKMFDWKLSAQKYLEVYRSL
ncbi:MAG: glycosyltransferase family 1 protein [Sphingobacteriia bacterium]|jgi:glycosyltransferase involved in cell wall biosynthesis